MSQRTEQVLLQFKECIPLLEVLTVQLASLITCGLKGNTEEKIYFAQLVHLFKSIIIIGVGLDEGYND